jgi:hypothetical protein
MANYLGRQSERQFAVPATPQEEAAHSSIEQVARPVEEPPVTEKSKEDPQPIPITKEPRPPEPEANPHQALNPVPTELVGEWQETSKTETWEFFAGGSVRYVGKGPPEIHLTGTLKVITDFKDPLKPPEALKNSRVRIALDTKWIVLDTKKKPVPLSPSVVVHAAINEAGDLMIDDGSSLRRLCSRVMEIRRSDAPEDKEPLPSKEKPPPPYPLSPPPSSRRLATQPERP